MPPKPPTLHSTTSIPSRPKGRVKSGVYKPSQYQPSYLAARDPNVKKLTQSDLKRAQQLREQRYQDLLHCARNKDMEAIIILPSHDKFQIEMKKVVNTIAVKIELLDIYHYLKTRSDLGTLPFKVTKSDFGNLIGCHMPASTLRDMLDSEASLRDATESLPDGACYMVKRKSSKLEQVLLEWIKLQRDKQTPVNGRMIKRAAAITFMVLEDAEDEDDEAKPEVLPSFSASWFDRFKKRHRISYVKLHGEESSVDLAAIEPELVEIRELCSHYHPDNIYNCDETGLYLRELDTKTYTVAQSAKGAKASRSSRVSILFCINASGTSLAHAERKDALKPLVLSVNTPRDLDPETNAGLLRMTTPKGWMNRDTFLWWLRRLDDQLEQPSLLLIDSCPAHNDVEFRDRETNESWRHLTIRRLPVNSTPVTQPLDAGVISVFKRAFLELLSQDTSIVRSLTDDDNISLGTAWSLIPEAWSHLKPRTLRSCFTKTPVLPPQTREYLKNTPPEIHSHTIRPRRRHRLRQQERQYFERLVAMVSEKERSKFSPDENPHEDEQDVAYKDFLDELVEMEIAEIGGSTHQSMYQNMNDELRSSPIEPEDWDSAAQVLRELSDGFDVCSPQGLEYLRQNAKVSGEFAGDLVAVQEFNASIKALARASRRMWSARKPRPGLTLRSRPPWR